LFKSQFEKNVAKEFRKYGIKFTYEPEVVRFLQPEKQRKYIPDFRIKTKMGNVFLVETKGKLDADDRKKLEWVKAQNPDLNLVLLFMNSDVKLRKGSKTTYGMWATKAGFTWYDFRAGLPQGWTEHR
jgi:predicted nuclease of restriction endonuclease-like RecB superfamily